MNVDEIGDLLAQKEQERRAEVAKQEEQERLREEQARPQVREEILVPEEPLLVQAICTWLNDMKESGTPKPFAYTFTHAVSDGLKVSFVHEYREMLHRIMKQFKGERYFILLQENGFFEYKDSVLVARIFGELCYTPEFLEQCTTELLTIPESFRAM